MARDRYASAEFVNEDTAVSLYKTGCDMSQVEFIFEDTALSLYKTRCDMSPFFKTTQG